MLPRISSPRPAHLLVRFLPWALLCLIIACAAIIRVRLLQIPLERDEGEYAYAGQLILQGIPPYQLIFNMKFPGTYAAYAAIMAVFGQTIASIHIGLLIINAGAIILIYWLGRRLFTPASAVAASAVYALLSLGEGVMGTMAHATHFVVLAALGATLLLIHAIDSQKVSRLFWSGLLYGLAILMKQHGVTFAAFGAGYLIWDHVSQQKNKTLGIIKKLGVFLGGAAAPILLTGLALWWAGVFSTFWFWTFTYAHQYVSEMSWSEGFYWLTTNGADVIGPNIALWILALLGLILLWCNRQYRAQAVFISGFLVFSFLAMCPGLYFRGHYFILVLPVIALLAGSVLTVMQTKRPDITLVTYALFATALTFSVVQQQEFLFYMGPVEVSRDIYDLIPFPEAIKVGDYIRTHSDKGASIAVLGSEPEIPFYADRHSATGIIYMYGLMEDQPYALQMQKELARDVETARPEYIVFETSASAWGVRKSTPTFIFDWWHAYNQQHYKIVGIADAVSKDESVYQWERLPNDPAWPSSGFLIYRRVD